VLWKKVRAAELTAEQALERFEGLGKMGLRIVATGSIQSQAIQLAIETGRTVYDSLYLALAMAEECGLVTADEPVPNPAGLALKRPLYTRLAFDTAALASP
jgi:predicted nucleic acid-binding protein